MNIGIDARQLSGPMIGTRRALEAILQEWTRRDLKGHRIFLYSPKAIELDFVHPFYYRIGSRLGAIIGGTFWLQTELPLMVRRDALDVFWATTDIVPLPLAGGLPCLLTVQDLGYFRIADQLSPYVRLIYSLFFSRSLRAARMIVCTTSATKEELEHLGHPGDKITVVHHGVDLQGFAGHTQGESVIRERYGITVPYFLFVGHLRANKNVERTLMAFRDFLGETALMPKPSFVIVGGRTRTDSAIFKLMEDPVLKNHVRYLGYLTNGELPLLYANALGFVSPSIYEGFGLPFLEALAAGVPVLAPKIPTASEICGDAAVYVDPLSVESISAGFRELSEGNCDLEQLRVKARERAQQFGWPLAAQRIWQLLERLAKKSLE